MRTEIVLILVIGILVSGCISSPFEQVPVVKVNISFIEKQGFVEAQNYTLTQGFVDYVDRPKRIHAESFPAISARTNIKKGKNLTVGPWESEPYKGTGNYSFNLGFGEKYIPESNETVGITIMVLNKTGDRIGYATDNILWK